MPRCTRMVEIGRRQFLRGGALAAGAIAVRGGAAQAQQAEPALARVTYPASRLANVADLTPDEPHFVTYPDEDAPGVLLKLGTPIEGGVGPDRDIVGFTTVCPHKGFPLNYNAANRTLTCPGHYSIFDVEKGGQQVWGQATQNLPQYMLRVDEAGDIYGEGVDELLYGRVSNVL